MAQWRLIFAAALSTQLMGCGSHGPRHVTDNDPDDKIPAIKVAAASHDRSAIPQLVKDLESDDPAVRFYAIDGLNTLTGQTFGYRYFENDEKRKAAVSQWKAWLKEQKG